MFEQGFIMREVQKMVQMLQVVIGLKKEGNFSEALQQIDQSYTRFFDLNREKINEENWEEIVQRCSPGNKFSAELGFALGDLIKEEAEILEAHELVTEAKKKYTLALKLYERAMQQKNAAVPLNAQQKMKTIHKKLE